MQSHHYLGALPKIGNTLWYVATWEGEWLALLSFSAAALKCGARDRWKRIMSGLEWDPEPDTMTDRVAQGRSRRESQPARRDQKARLIRA